MESVDYLLMKTTNINIRISPMLKSQLIERGAKMGINLSDYIGYVLTKEISGQNDPKQSDEYQELERKSKFVHSELMKYVKIGEPFKDWIGKDFVIDGKSQRFEHLADLLNYFANNFKVKR